MSVARPFDELRAGSGHPAAKIVEGLCSEVEGLCRIVEGLCKGGK